MHLLVCGTTGIKTSFSTFPNQTLALTLKEPEFLYCGGVFVTLNQGLPTWAWTHYEFSILLPLCPKCWITDYTIMPSLGDRFGLSVSPVSWYYVLLVVTASKPFSWERQDGCMLNDACTNIYYFWCACCVFKICILLYTCGTGMYVWIHVCVWRPKVDNGCLYHA